MKKIFVILASALLLFGCEEPKDNIEEEVIIEGTITLSSNEIIFQNNGNLMPGSNNVVEITSSDDWILSGKTSSWCSVSAKSGANGETITFTVEPNPDQEDRTLTYDLICGNSKSTLTVTQYKMLTTEAGRTDYSLDYKGGDLSVLLKSDKIPALNFSDGTEDWVSLDKVGVLMPNGYRWWFFSVDENDDYRNRNGEIIFNKDKDDEITINVKQTPGFVIMPTEDDTTPKNIVVDISGTTITIDIMSNLEDEYTVSATPSLWIKNMGSVDLVGDYPIPAKRHTFEIQPALGYRAGGKISFSNRDPYVPSVDYTVTQMNDSAPHVQFNEPAVEEFLNRYSNYVIKHDDGYELTHDGANITFIDVAGQGLTSLENTMKDIETYFHNVQMLRCFSNNLTEIDISAVDHIVQMQCHANGVSVMKLGNNRISSISFDGTHWHYSEDGTGTPTSFTISGNYLSSLNIYNERQEALEVIDISECPNLQNMTCARTYGMGPKVHTIWLKNGQNVPMFSANFDANSCVQYKP